MEIIAGVERRHRWRLEEKLRIVAEVEQPGASFAAVARRHELSRGPLRELAGAGPRRGTGARADAGVHCRCRSRATCRRWAIPCPHCLAPSRSPALPTSAMLCTFAHSRLRPPASRLRIGRSSMLTHMTHTRSGGERLCNCLQGRLRGTDLTFPEHDDPPTQVFQCGLIRGVAPHVVLELPRPEVDVALGHPSLPAPRMTVPKAAVHEDDRAPAGEHEIRPAR
jgi:hypothetical protein